jgi:hypothetical protein
MRKYRANYWANNQIEDIAPKQLKPQANFVEPPQPTEAAV